MAERQSGIVKPPNNGEFSTNKAANGYLPLARDASPAHPPNLSRFMHGDAGGSFSQGRQGSPIAPPNDGKFDDGDPGYTDRPNSAVEPGKGSIPVNPFLQSGGIMPASEMRDSAKR